MKLIELNKNITFNKVLFSVFSSCLLFVFATVNVSANNVFNEYRNTYDENKKVAYVGGKLLRRYISGGDFQSKLIKINFEENTTANINGPWNNSKGVIHKVSLSKTGKYLSLLYSRINVNTSLYVVSISEGNKILKIDENVKVYDWSPDSNKIVYNKSSDGVYVYSLDDGNKFKITDDVRELSWALFDNSIYFIRGGYYESKYYKVDSKNFKISKSIINGIDFSPNGNYYARAIVEEESMVYPGVYVSSNNEKIASFAEEASHSRGMSEYNWVNNNTVAFQSLTSFFLYDVAAKKIIRNNLDIRTTATYKPNSFAPVSYGGKYLVVYKDGFWELQDIFSGNVIKKVKNTSFKHIKR